MNPSRPDDLTSRGANALTQHDYASALTCFTAALAQHPDDLSLRCYEVAALLGLARYVEALGKIDAILAGTPLDAVNRAHILVGKANALTGLERWQEAEPVIDEATGVLKEHANAWLLRGQIALHAANHEKALESFRKAIDAGVGATDETQLMAGWCLLKLERFSEAKDDFFDVMLHQGGRMPQAFWGMATAARELGEIQLAIQYCEQFIQLGGGGSPASLAAAQRMLDELRRGGA
jgi:tetratricopeptide (TPR) repeat protein